MTNLCLIKVSGDRILQQWRTDQDYSNFQAKAEAILAAANAKFSETRTLEGFACCDADLLQAAIDGGATWADGPSCDFDVKLKSAVTSETIIPPVGVAVSDIPSTDYVVCHA